MEDLRAEVARRQQLAAAGDSSHSTGKLCMLNAKFVFDGVAAASNAHGCGCATCSCTPLSLCVAPLLDALEDAFSLRSSALASLFAKMQIAGRGDIWCRPV